MPAIRPEASSNRIRLSNEFGAAVLGLVSEDGAVDSLLSAIVNELSPNKHSVGVLGSQDDLFARADELRASLLAWLAQPTVVASVEREAIGVSVAREPPERLMTDHVMRPAI
jgi:hypothetical protein